MNAGSISVRRYNRRCGGGKGERDNDLGRSGHQCWLKGAGSDPHLKRHKTLILIKRGGGKRTVREEEKGLGRVIYNSSRPRRGGDDLEEGEAIFSAPNSSKID